MGSKISIDKHVSNLEDILEMNPKYFSKLKFENKIPDNITQHIKIWRFFEDVNTKKVQTLPVSLQHFQTSGFTFLSTECYLVLVVYRKTHSDYSTFITFPHSLWGLVESYSNLTPRGLELPVASSEDLSQLNKEILDSFLMPRRTETQTMKSLKKTEYEYMLFVWNGKTANPIIKSFALSNAFEMENLINKGEDPFLRVLFSGGVITNKKLQKGTIIQLNTSASKSSNKRKNYKKFSNIMLKVLENEVKNLRETIYLFKFLFPDNSFKKPEKPVQEFSETCKTQNLRLLSSLFKNSNNDYNSLFLNLSKEPSFLQRELLEPLSDPKEFTKDTSREKEEFDGSKPKKMKIPSLPLSMNIQQNEENLNDFNINRQTAPKMKIPHLKLTMTGSCGEINEDSGNNHYEEGFEEGSDGCEKELLMKEEHINVEFPKKTFRVDKESSFDERNSENSMKRAQIKNLELHHIKMKISDDNFMNVNYWDIANEDKEGFNFDIRDTTRKFIKMEHFSSVCSEIIPGLLYVGGETIAYNKELLENLGVTHIINCAGDICEEKFKDSFQYKTFYLKDTKTENIECIFYECIFWIEKASNKKGKVLVHCVQGVSRSVSICIAYLIFKRKYTYDEAFNLMKKSRGVCSPNTGFIVQLLLFYKRLYESFDSIPATPRVFCISSHQLEQPALIVARHLIEPLYNTRNNKVLDKRGIFIIQTKKQVFVWTGSLCEPLRKQRYMECVLEYLTILQKYEKANTNVQYLEEGSEPKEFWMNWGFFDSEPPIKSRPIKEWDNWYLNMQNPLTDAIEQHEPSLEDVADVEDSKDDLNDFDSNKPMLFLYPNFNEPLGIFDFEDLGEENLCVLCQNEEFVKKVFIWKGGEFVADGKEEEVFVGEVVRSMWGEINLEELIVIKEMANNESEEFMDCFH